MIYPFLHLSEPVRIVNDLGPLAHAARDPHGGIKMAIPSISSEHVDIKPELVQARVDIVSSDGVVECLQHVQGPSSPPVGLDLDIRRLFVVCLEEVSRVELCGQFGKDVLVVVAAELGCVRKMFSS